MEKLPLKCSKLFRGIKTAVESYLEPIQEIKERLVIAELANLFISRRKTIDLLKSALLIGIDNEHFNLNDYLKKADLLADQIKSEFPKHSNDEQRIKILVSQLFDEMGFHGSTLDFHHAQIVA